MSFRAVPLIFLIAWHFPYPATAAPAPAPVPGTGQTICHETASPDIVDCAGKGQDVDTFTGVPLPETRFMDNGDRTVTDKLTGLTWAGDADPAGGHMRWQQALAYVASLNSRKYLGYNDWRLPNVNELKSLVNKQPDLARWLTSQGFRSVRKDYYWTSSTYAAYTACAWSVGMVSGIVAGRGKEDAGYVWPVRKGQARLPALPKTGQDDCHDASGKAVPCAGTGQDGDAREGAAWPVPRFTENNDRTVTDRLTGLIWSREADAPGPAQCAPGMRKTWKGALNHVECLNANSYLGHRDWRLPNRNELASIVNHGQAGTAAWLNAQGFRNVRSGSYWTSGTYSYSELNAWSVNLQDGAITSCAKRHDIHIWPVRGGNSENMTAPAGEGDRRKTNTGMPGRFKP